VADSQLRAVHLAAVPRECRGEPVLPQLGADEFVEADLQGDLPADRLLVEPGPHEKRIPILPPGGHLLAQAADAHVDLGFRHWNPRPGDLTAQQPFVDQLLERRRLQLLSLRRLRHLRGGTDPLEHPLQISPENRRVADGHDDIRRESTVILPCRNGRSQACLGSGHHHQDHHPDHRKHDEARHEEPRPKPDHERSMRRSSLWRIATRAVTIPSIMSKIAISLCGEGRGHATRICTLVEHLAADHDILLYTSADALEFLERRFPRDDPRVRVIGIPGIVFQYVGGRLDVVRSIAAGLDYQARQIGPLVDRMIGELDAFGADLAITDFEPALPRAASRLGIPLVSVDHQHFLLAYDLDALPWTLQWNAWFMSHAVWMYVSEATDTVVSAFFRPPLRRGWEHVVQVGPLLRAEVVQARPRDDGFILSYLRRHTPFSAIDALAECGRPVRVYGLGSRPSVGSVSFHEIDDVQFVADLAACHALVAAAGNQLIGEALHLGKPMLVLPERAHAEQLMNSHFLAAMGCGEFCLLEEFGRGDIEAFLTGVERFRPARAAVAGRMDGTPDVLRVIQHRLEHVAATPA